MMTLAELEKDPGFGIALRCWSTLRWRRCACGSTAWH